MSIYDKSSLVLIPSGTKTGKVYSQKPVSGDGDFTFTRSSAATRVNADGNIEKETSNLLLQSNTFDTTWTQSNNPIITSGQLGYDGTSDAWKIELTAAYGQIVQSISISGLNCTSVYAKAGTIDFIRFRIDGSPNSIVDFNLTDGSTAYTSGNIYATSTSVGGGWYRLSMVSNISSSTLRIYPLVAANDLSGTSGNILIQDAQIEQGMVARDVITTTTAAVYGGITDNTPRLDYTDSSCPALLLEPQRTNLVPHSEYFGASDWVKTGLTIASNEVTSPDGNLNGTEVTISNGSHFLFDIISVSPSTTYTFSWYAKRGTATNVSYSVYDDTNGADIIPSTSYYSQLSDTEWKRISVQFTTSATTTSARPYVLRDGGQTGTISIYGAQLEAGHKTSYIPTYGSSVTRNVDTTYIENGMTSLNSVDSMTIYFEVDAELLDGSQRYSVLTSLTASNNWIFLSYESNTSIRGYIRGNSNTSWDFSWSSGVPSSGTIKAALVIPADGNAKIYGNGQLRTSYSGAVLVNGFDTIALGGTNGAAGRKQALKQFMVFPTALTDQELIDLTTL